MKHIFTMIAEDIFPDAEGRFSYIKEFGVLYGSKLPISYFVLRVGSKYAVEERDRGESLTHITRIVDPDGETAYEVSISSTEHNKNNHMYIASFFNVAFQKKGTYKIVSLFEGDNKPRNELSLEVELRG